MIKEAIAKLVKLQNLSEAEARDVMSEIMTGQATEAQIAAYITAMRMKGESVEEITGSARVMRSVATPIQIKTRIGIDRDEINIEAESILDTCGTGGDGTNTFNVSTASALVIAACGLQVAKHGNRSVSSACGSADVLEALGLNLNTPPQKVEESISKIGIGFLFAPALHGAMKYAIGPRRQIGIRTIFNLLGPLTNPANANSQILGVYSEPLVEMIVQVLKNLGTANAWVVHGRDGTDEISITGPTRVGSLKNGVIDLFDVTPEEFGLKRGVLSDIKGGNAAENAKIITDILCGAKGSKRDIVLLNAGAGLFVSGKSDSVKSGIDAAAEALDSGKAKAILQKLIDFSNS